MSLDQLREFHNPLNVSIDKLTQELYIARGWTLQELLAPETVIFYDESWQEIGTKSSLRELLSEITKIKNMAEFESASVAQKMSWASMRETTRIEDQAYCLLGIFGLNMPTLYGEGRKAFYRLQLEIIKTSDDESIFAWAERDSRATNSELVGLLALSPSAFRRSGDIVRVENLDDSSTPYWMTNKGLRLELTLLEVIIPLPSFHFDGCLFAPLNCEWHGTSKRPGLYLVNVHKDQYLRSKSDKLVSINPGGVGTRQLPREVFYVKQTNELHYTGKANVDLDAVQIHILSVTSALQAGYKLTRFHTARMLTSSDTGIISACQKGDLFDYNSSIFYFNLVPDRIRGAFMFEDGDGDKFIIFINGTNSPWVDIVVPNYSNTESLPDLMRTFDRSIWDTRQSDRISRYIRSGQAVASAKIKPHSLNGGRVCLIDILVDESRTLLYPDPEAHIIRSSH